MKLKSRARTPRWVTGLPRWAPILVALASTHCGSEDDAKESQNGAGGTVGTGGTNTAAATVTATTATLTTSTSSATSSTTSTIGNTVTATTTTTSTTGVAGNTTGFGFGGPGAGGSGGGDAGGTGGGGTTGTPTTTTGTGGTDVAPGETGVFEGTVAAHNQARAEVDATPPLPEMVWSDELAMVAQEWADNLVSSENCGDIFHRTERMYGENIALVGSFGASEPFTGPDAVAMWVAEIECYTYGTIGQSEQCDSACIAAQNSNGCGHYTQVVWEDTTAVGCGYGTCEDGNSTIEVIVCNYDPPGNYIGETPY